MQATQSSTAAYVSTARGTASGLLLAGSGPRIASTRKDSCPLACATLVLGVAC